MQEGQNSLAW